MLMGSKTNTNKNIFQKIFFGVTQKKESHREIAKKQHFHPILSIPAAVALFS